MGALGRQRRPFHGYSKPSRDPWSVGWLTRTRVKANDGCVLRPQSPFSHTPPSGFSERSTMHHLMIVRALTCKAPGTASLARRDYTGVERCSRVRPADPRPAGPPRRGGGRPAVPARGRAGRVRDPGDRTGAARPGRVLRREGTGARGRVRLLL